MVVRGCEYRKRWAENHVEFPEQLAPLQTQADARHLSAHPFVMAQERRAHPPGAKAVIVARQRRSHLPDLLEVFGRAAEIYDVANNAGVEPRRFSQTVHHFGS